MRLGEREMSECHNLTPNGREAATAYAIVAYLANDREPVTLPCRNSPISDRAKYPGTRRCFSCLAGGTVPRKATYAVAVAGVA